MKLGDFVLPSLSSRLKRDPFSIIGLIPLRVSQSLKRRFDSCGTSGAVAVKSFLSTQTPGPPSCCLRGSPLLPALEAILVLDRWDPSAGDLRPPLTIFLDSHELREKPKRDNREIGNWANDLIVR